MIHASDLEVIPETLKKHPEIVDAFDQANQHTWTEAELEVYDYVAINERSAYLQLKRATAEAEARGEAKGEAKGEARGEAKGEVKGEAKANKKTAKTLKASGVATELIAQATGLSVKEIKEL
jgi:predicted transposase/invertase (TIGR01784 family)